MAVTEIVQNVASKKLGAALMAMYLLATWAETLDIRLAYLMCAVALVHIVTQTLLDYTRNRTNKTAAPDVVVTEAPSPVGES